MALFYKPSSKKKPAPARPADARDEPGRGGAAKKPEDWPSSVLAWSPAKPSIEVEESAQGLCAVLENAALLFASGQEAQARAILEQGVPFDAEANASPLAWQALFDVLQRAGDKAAFDQLALQYVVRFEQLAPIWEPRAKALVGPRVAAVGQFSLVGKITGGSAVQLDGLKRSIAKKMPGGRLNFAGVTAIDDEGAQLVASALAAARKAGLALQIQHPEAVQPFVAAAVAKGREAGQGLWQLGLELLQWQNDREAFEERAIDFAVAFELSPPSWEPARADTAAAGAPAGATSAAEPAAEPAADDVLVWSGTMTGSSPPQLAELAQFAERHRVVAVDMRGVDRVDWVCAGALLNAIARIEAKEKTVQLAGATPIVRALLLLIGIPARQFVRKPG